MRKKNACLTFTCRKISKPEICQICYEMKLPGRSELEVKLSPNLAGILVIFEISEKYRFRVEIGIVPESLRNEMWRNAWIPTLLREKKRFILKKIDFRLFWKISDVRLPTAVYRGIWGLDSIFAWYMLKISNFLFFEKANVNLNQTSFWAKNLISGQI